MLERRTRVSYEGQLLARIRDVVAGLPGVSLSTGQGAANRFDIPGWDLPPLQRFQYGDLRIETPTRTVVVEAESAGGLTNLIKYWPALASGPPAKPLILVHVFRLASAGDYIAHRRLWEFAVARIREQLATQHQIQWGDHWEAILLTYRTEVDAEQIARDVRATVTAQGVPATGG